MSRTTDTPPTERPSRDSRLKVVPLLDRTGLLHRLEHEPDALRVELEPIAQVASAGAIGFEARVGVSGAPAASPAEWSARGHAQQAGEIEAQLVAAALGARPRNRPPGDEPPRPVGDFLSVTVSGRGLISPAMDAVLGAAGGLRGVVVVVIDDGKPSDPPAVAAALERVRVAGGAIGVDVTGAGVAMLKQVARLAPEFIRVGHALVDDVCECRSTEAVLGALGGLAARIGSWVIASQIADVRTLQAVAELGVPLVQGPVIGTRGPDDPRLDIGTAGLLLAARPLSVADGTVGPLVETASALGPGAGMDLIADRFLVDPARDALVQVDDAARPVRLLDRASLLRGDPYDWPPGVVTSATPLREVARRVAERTPPERWMPFVCVDAFGGYIGLVPIERVLAALAA